jgi:OFA family oxalate/formate antiporter-like MFS transporter
MPATAGDFFGVKNAGGIYGLMLIGWSIGGVVGPLIAAALIGAEKNYTSAYTTIGIIALVAIALPVITKIPRVRNDGSRHPRRDHDVTVRSETPSARRR